jgi:two-component system, NarL family, sensor kinase
MPGENEQIIVEIIAVILVLLFLGILFLLLILYYNNKKKQMTREKQQMKDLFDQQLLQSKLEIQQQILNSVSQEIHDNVGQILSLAKVQLNIIEQKETYDSKLIKETKSSLTQAIGELRDIARSLNTEKNRSFNWIEAVEEEINKINKSEILKASLRLTGDNYLNEQYKIIVFRIIQEGLQNILKHANATEICLHIHQSPDQITILLEDNGTGFSPEKALQENTGIGLKNMMTRSKLIGATLSFKHNQPSGSILNLTIHNV